MLLLAHTPALLSAQGVWEIANVTQSPSARRGTAMATGPGGEVVLFGGEGNASRYGDTWHWDGSSWSVVPTTSSPPATAFHGMVFDEGRQRIVLFGGFDNTETWEFDGIEWAVRTTATTPPARHHHAMAYDATRRRVLLFGGENASGILADTWEYDGLDWVLRATPSHPSARAGHAMAFDPRTGQTVLFGGRNANQSLTYDTWLWNGNGWSLAWLYTNIPAPRSGHAMAFHPLRFRVVLFGDELGFGTTHEWDGTQWWPTAGTLPTSQRTSSLGLAWHAATERIVAFGGATPGTGDPLQLTQLFRSVQPARATAFGTGCANYVGVPELGIDRWSLPWAGDALDHRLDNVQAGSLTLLVFGLQRDALGSLPLPLDMAMFGAPGCTGYVAPLCALQLASYGPIQHRIYLPYQQGFAGLEFYEQAFMLNPGGPNGHGFSASNAMALRFGLR
jgi:hypothetical protein